MLRKSLLEEWAMRPLRAKVETAAYYHVMSRAMERRFIFDDVAAERFVQFMRQVEEFTGVQVVTYCIMSNHVHLLIHVPARQAVSDEDMLDRLRKGFSPMAFERFKARWDRMAKQGSTSGLDQLRQGVLQRMFDLSFFMKELKQRFSTWHNFREKRRGPVWEDRFKSTLIENKPGYLATAAAYIDNNPVRAGIATDPKDFRHCGYAAALAGETRAQEGLALLVAAFGIKGSAALVLSRYRLLLFGKGIAKEGKAGCTREEMEQTFAQNGELKPWELAKHRLRWLSDGLVIGSKAFVQDMRSQLLGKQKLQGSSRGPEMSGPPDMATLRRLRQKAGE
jgi:putative transposase